MGGDLFHGPTAQRAGRRETDAALTPRPRASWTFLGSSPSLFIFRDLRYRFFPEAHRAFSPIRPRLLFPRHFDVVHFPGPLEGRMVAEPAHAVTKL